MSPSPPPTTDSRPRREHLRPAGLPPHRPHADHAEADRLIAAGRLEAIAEFEYRPSPLVLLDSRPAWDLPDNQHPIIERIRLLHVKP